MRTDPEIPDLLTPEQVGEVIGMTKQGVMKLIHAGEIPARQVGRQYVVRRSVAQARNHGTEEAQVGSSS